MTGEADPGHGEGGPGAQVGGRSSARSSLPPVRWEVSGEVGAGTVTGSQGQRGRTAGAGPWEEAAGKPFPGRGLVLGPRSSLPETAKTGICPPRGQRRGGGDICPPRGQARPFAPPLAPTFTRTRSVSLAKMTESF